MCALLTRSYRVPRSCDWSLPSVCSASAEKSDKIKRGEATKAETKEYAKLKAERAKEVKAQRREKSSRRASSTVNSQ